MTKELTRYNGYRYVMRKGQTVSDDPEKTKAGRAMLMHADMYVWESNAALVARAESFLRGAFRGIPDQRQKRAGHSANVACLRA